MGTSKQGHKKIAGFTRRLVADNIVALLKKHYPAKPNITQMQHAFCEESGVNFSTVQRICNELTGASIDTLEQIAAHFELSAYQLLIPELDAGNPQVVRGASKAEQRMYPQWRKEKSGTAPTVPATVKAGAKRASTT